MSDKIEPTIKIEWDGVPEGLKSDLEMRASNDLMASELRMEDVEQFMAYRDAMRRQHLVAVCIEAALSVAVIAAAIKYLAT